MDTKQAVNRLFNGHIGNKLFELTKLPPEEIYEYAKKIQILVQGRIQILQMQL